MELYVDKTAINDAIRSIAGSTAVQSLYLIALGVCKLSEWLLWLSAKLHEQCQKFLVFAKNKKSGRSKETGSRSGKVEFVGSAEVSHDKIS
jgi:hypothetical protein